MTLWHYFFLLLFLVTDLHPRRWKLVRGSSDGWDHRRRARGGGQHRVHHGEEKEEVCSLCTSPSPPVSSRLRSEPRALFYILLFIYFSKNQVTFAKQSPGFTRAHTRLARAAWKTQTGTVVATVCWRFQCQDFFEDLNHTGGISLFFQNPYIMKRSPSRMEIGS